MLAQPLTLPCGNTIKNRLVKAAMTEGLASPQDQPNESHLRLYETWAKGGASVLITGNIMIDRCYLERAGNVVVEDERDFAMLQQWVKTVAQQGAQLWAQISHPGRQCPRMVNAHPLSASDVQLKLVSNFAKPRAAQLHEIQEIIKRFTITARVLKKAGFHGVQVHSAHGYLLSQFLSPITNQRTDAYGGNLENRARLLLEVVRAVRAEVGPDFTLSVKLNSSDFQKGAFSLDECKQVVQWLNECQVDLLEISGGTYEQLVFFKSADGQEPNPNSPQSIVSHQNTTPRQSTVKREAFFLEYAKEIKSIATMPIMVTGGFRTSQAMESALEANETDAIGVARPFCTNLDFPNKMLSGSLALLPSKETDLNLGLGFWGANSSSKLIQTLNMQAQAGWYYHQIESLAAGEGVDENCSPRKALFQHLGKDMVRAIKRKFA